MPECQREGANVPRPTSFKPMGIPQISFPTVTAVVVEGEGMRLWHVDHANPRLWVADDGQPGARSTDYWSCLPPGVNPEEEAAALEQARISLATDPSREALKAWGTGMSSKRRASKRKQKNSEENGSAPKKAKKSPALNKLETWANDEMEEDGGEKDSEMGEQVEDEF